METTEIALMTRRTYTKTILIANRASTGEKSEQSTKSFVQGRRGSRIAG